MKERFFIPLPQFYGAHQLQRTIVYTDVVASELQISFAYQNNPQKQ